MSAVLRFKRKACDEPVEGLVVVSKKSKCDETSNTNDETSNTNEVYFKFAATLKNDTESIKDHLQAALSKDKSSRFSKWRNPKSRSSTQKSAQQVCEKLKTEYKVANEKKKLDLLNNRRLIFYDTFPIEEEDQNPLGESAEVRKLFQLYDIIEENEEAKKQVEETESTITCNDEPLIREKLSDYVYDVYIADVLIDDSFVENTVSVRPCKVTDEDIDFGDSDNSGEVYEDEDDSNDENNWRNEYPEDENSHSEQESGDDSYDAYDCVVNRSVNRLQISDDDDEYEESYDRSRILKDLDAGSDEEN